MKNEGWNETILYADGANPRYDGTASAHVSTLGGRYDYTFDCHDRLVRANYQETDDRPRANPENFSTEYTYNEVGAPLSVRRYGQNGVMKSGDLEIKKYGLMDDLSYAWDGMMLSSVTAQAAGTEFYGRTGYPLSAAGGVAQYAWNKAGMLYSDTSRGIKKTTYNHMGQPSTVEFTDGGELRYTYSAAGELLGVSTFAVLAGKRRPVKVSERSYCGDFVFEGDSLAYVNFPGGYFDGNGGAHYRHPDFQGNITMVTDSDGKIEQHTGYYPYGEPWHEPAGQPYLYGGKERMRDGGLNDYDFSARRLNSAVALWSTPDPLAFKNTHSNPYVYCSGNPIRYIDPTGKAELFMYQKKKGMVLLGNFGENDGKVFLVNDKLGKKIEKEKKNNQKYNIPNIANSEEMADLSDINSNDIETIGKLMVEGNADGLERGMNKDTEGKTYIWDKGIGIKESNGVIRNRIKMFKVSDSGSDSEPSVEKSVWYMHLHPKNPENYLFGYSDPSLKDTDYDNKKRNDETNPYKGTTFLLGGKDKKVTFYYGEKTIISIPFDVLKNFIKEHSKKK